MSTKKQQARMTIYRLINLPALKCAIRKRYRDSDNLTCQEQNIKIGDREAFLLTGTVEPGSAPWAKTIGQITGISIEIGNKTALAVLLIPSESDASNIRHTSDSESTAIPFISAWAITFGMGFQALDTQYIDIGFGKRIAIRSANPDSLNMVGKVTLDEKPQMIRSTIPSGGTLRRFGFDEFSELATRIIANANLEGIGENVKIKGSDSLSIPLPTSPQELLDKIDQLETILRKPVPENLKPLDHLSLVKAPELKNRLEQCLAEAILTDNDQEQLALSYPYDAIDEIGDPDAYKIFGAGRSAMIDGYPTLDRLLSIVKRKSEDNVLNKLNRLSIVLFKNEKESIPLSSRIPVKKWLTFQKTLNDVRYFLQNNQWYSMDEPYVRVVQDKVQEIFNRGPYFEDIPDWIIQAQDKNKISKRELQEINSEKTYNILLARELNGLCLDRKLVNPIEGASSIEACDVLLKGGIFIHVKNAASSAPVSHLLAQALVSTDILLSSDTAREKLEQRIVEVGGDLSEYDTKPKRVVIVIAKDRKPLTAESLYTFSKINLIRHDSLLAPMGIELNIAPIVRKEVEQNS